MTNRFALFAAAFVVTLPAYAADQVLSGTITTPSGQKLDGVTVSAKLEGATITTSVYTDANGEIGRAHV